MNPRYPLGVHTTSNRAPSAARSSLQVVLYMCFLHRCSINAALYLPQYGTFLRRERDSNPRNPNEFNGFRDRPIQPLSHLSNLPEAERIRTSDLQIRNLKLYPAELQPHSTTVCSIRSRGDSVYGRVLPVRSLRPASAFCRRLPAAFSSRWSAKASVRIPILGNL